MTFETSVVGFPKTYANICKICYIFRILQDFATKLCGLLILSVFLTMMSDLLLLRGSKFNLPWELYIN